MNYSLLHSKVKVFANISSTELNNFSFSDRVCIKLLCRFRDKIDKYSNIKLDDILDVGSCPGEINVDLICAYSDLERLIKNSNLTRRQNNILNLIADGYNYTEIGEKLNCSDRTVAQTFNVVINKIKKTNDDMWFNFIYLNWVKGKWDYKKCNKCNKFYPAIRKFFSPDDRNKDKLRGICKKCDNYTKNPSV